MTKSGLFHIVASTFRGDCVIGTVRELPSGGWKWHGLGRSSMKAAATAEDAKKAAMRALGNVRFEEA